MFVYYTDKLFTLKMNLNLFIYFAFLCLTNSVKIILWKTVRNDENFFLKKTLGFNHYIVRFINVKLLGCFIKKIYSQKHALNVTQFEDIWFMYPFVYIYIYVEMYMSHNVRNLVLLRPVFLSCTWMYVVTRVCMYVRHTDKNHFFYNTDNRHIDIIHNYRYNALSCVYVFIS